MKKLAALLMAVLWLFTASAALAEDACAPLLRAGGSFGLALDAKGVLWGWGDNRSGQLGNGGHELARLPELAATGLDGAQVKDIQCGNVSALFLMKDGTVFSCGNNNYGQQGQGDGSAARFTQPVQVQGLSGITQIACGFGQCLALTDGGQVYTWGRNNVGQTGVGKIRSVNAPELLPLENITQIACGGKFCLAMDAEGGLWGWGENDFGQIGDACPVGKGALSPVRLTMDKTFVQIACGSDASYGVDAAGAIWAWGRNDYWQLGDDTVGRSSAVPVQVKFPETVQVRVVDAYSSHIAAETVDGALWQWGSTFQGQLGIDDRPWHCIPIKACPDSGVAMAAVGSLQSYVLLTDGTVMSTGFNKYGQLGAYRRHLNHSAVWVNTGLNLLTGEWTDPEN